VLPPAANLLAPIGFEQIQRPSRHDYVCYRTDDKSVRAQTGFAMDSRCDTRIDAAKGKLSLPEMRPMAGGQDVVSLSACDGMVSATGMRWSWRLQGPKKRE
jgi:hypothetical protein